MIRKFSLPLILIALAGCSTEEAEQPSTGENTAPQISAAANAATINEGESVTFPFNVVDDNTGYSSLKFKLITENTQGKFSLDVAGKSISYEAPMLRGSVKSISDGAILEVTDPSGLKSERAFSVSVSDINGALSLKLLPPAGGFGYENTQTDKVLNLFMYEGPADATFRISLTEDVNDGDDIDMGFPEDPTGIFANQISENINDDLSEVTLRFPLPQIVAPSTEITLSYRAQDNDGDDEVNINVTVVNKPTLAWKTAGTSTAFTESAGGSLSFDFSEVSSYPGEFTASVTMEDGSALPFTLPVSVEQSGRKINIGPSGRILGDTPAKVTLKHTFTVANAAGERFDVVTSAERNITIKDDRDDDFMTKTEQFNQTVSQIENIVNRSEESAIFRSLSTLLTLDNRVSKSGVALGKSSVIQAMSVEKANLETLSNEIKQLISEGKTSEADGKIDEYLIQANRVGALPRAAISDWFDDHVSAETTGNTPLTISWSAPALIKAESGWSHYVGNLNYGFFDTDNGGAWVYKKNYAYLGAVDTDTSICE